MQSESSTLLIVDDEPQIVAMVKETLDDDFKGQILTANNPKEALTIIRTQMNDGRFDIDTIISDIKMPEMSGHEFLMELRSQGISTPVIFLSGYIDVAAAMHALRLDAFDLLSKPFDPDTLISTTKISMNIGFRQRRIRGMLSHLQVIGLTAGIPDETGKDIVRTLEEIRKEERMMALLQLRNSSLKK